MRRLLLFSVACVAVAVGFLNFVWFFSESSTIGDASRGFVRDGHYFLVRAGVATEVTRETYEWSSFHGASIFVTHPLAMLGGAYLIFTVGFPAMVGGYRGPDRQRRVDRIEASGDVLAAATTGGRIGELRLTRPLVHVDVRPDGVIIKPFAMPAIGIEASEIRGVGEGRLPLTGASVEIEHGQAGSPRIRLLLDEQDPVVAAVRSIAGGSSTHATGPIAPEPVGRVTPGQPEPYSTEMKLLIVLGFGLAVVFAAVAIPFGRQLGAFGTFWLIAIVAIIAFNAWTYFVRNRGRW
jgi:hypothetical protein